MKNKINTMLFFSLFKDILWCLCAGNIGQVFKVNESLQLIKDFEEEPGNNR